MKPTTGIMARAAMRARTDMAGMSCCGMTWLRPRVTVVKMRANIGSPLPGADRSARRSGRILANGGTEPSVEPQTHRTRTRLKLGKNTSYQQVECHPEAAAQR